KKATVMTEATEHGSGIILNHESKTVAAVGARVRNLKLKGRLKTYAHRLLVAEPNAATFRLGRRSHAQPIAQQRGVRLQDEIRGRPKAVVCKGGCVNSLARL